MENSLATDMEKAKGERSYFNGDKLSNAFFAVLLLIFRVASLDILTPIVICSRLQWQAEHTYINGRRMVFVGKVSDLFVKNIFWILLSILTFGIFIPFKLLKTAQWETENMHFVGVLPANYDSEKSEFNCKPYVYFGLNVLYFFGIIFSLGIAYFWLYSYKEKIFTEYKYIDGHQLTFNATAKNYFIKRILWLFLSIATLGIYAIMLKGKLLRWRISYTNVKFPQEIPYSEAIADEQSIRPINKSAYICFFLSFPALLFLICSWSSRVVCRNGIHSTIIIVPHIICVAALCLSVIMLVLSYRSFKFSIEAKTGRRLPIILFVLTMLIIITSLTLLGYIIFLTVYNSF